jgi:hypothetical protein
LHSLCVQCWSFLCLEGGLFVSLSKKIVTSARDRFLKN